MPRPAAVHLCEICSDQYRPNYAGQRTCGRACGKVLRSQGSAARQVWPTCRVYIAECMCGRWFTSRQGRKACSKACADREYSARCRPGPTEHQCQGCGVTISNRRFKCDACVAANRAARKRRDKARRRALKSGAVVVEAFTLAEIAKRDRCRCGICGKRVAMTKVVPHPKAPTIDHIVPMDERGDHSRANVRLAHFICNSLRGNRGGGEQLALVG